MSSALFQLFAFMSCTFMLGLFLGWAFWRYEGASKEAVDSLESQVDFWKRSFDQSRLELWNLQEEHSALREEAEVKTDSGDDAKKS